MEYIIRDKEAGNVIESHSTLIDAQKALKEFEKTDKKEGNYTEDFYEIVEREDVKL